MSSNIDNRVAELKRHDVRSVILNRVIPDSNVYQTLATKTKDTELEILPIIVFTAKKTFKGRRAKNKAIRRLFCY